jgi:hypothetical protein
MSGSPRAWFTAQWLAVAAIIGLAITGVVCWRSAIAGAERDRAVRIAARKYLVEFNQPAPPYRMLAADQVACVLVKWDRARVAYVVGFGRQAIVPGTPRDSSGRNIPYVSGDTTVDYFSVKQDGRCDYLGSISAGPY